MTDFWRDWIKTGCNMALVSGLIFVLAAFPVTDFFARAFYDFVYWPLDGKSDFSDAARPTIAILGAVFVAWAWLLRGVVHIALDNPTLPQSVALWRAITSSVVLWWVVDSGVSVACSIPVKYAFAGDFFGAGDGEWGFEAGENARWKGVMMLSSVLYVWAGLHP